MASETADQDPQEFELPHYRGPDYREHYAEGFVYRVEGTWVVLTFYRSDVLIRGERMALQRHPETGDTYYASVGLNQEQTREDSVSIRMPLDHFLIIAQSLNKEVAAPSSSEAPTDGE